MIGTPAILIGISVVLRFILAERSRRRLRRAVASRPPLPDAEYLRATGAIEADASLWLAVRRAISDACGVPGESLRPQDRLEELWALKFDGLDFQDLVFRLERGLGVKLPRATFESMLRARPGDFGSFAAGMVDGLRRVNMPWR